MRVAGVVLLFPLIAAGILELLVASLDSVAAGGRGAEHVDQWYRYLADHKLQVHLALWHVDTVSHRPSHLSLPYEGITVCCVTDLNDICINVHDAFHFLSRKVAKNLAEWHKYEECRYPGFRWLTWHLTPAAPWPHDVSDIKCPPTFWSFDWVLILYLFCTIVLIGMDCTALANFKTNVSRWCLSRAHPSLYLWCGNF